MATARPTWAATSFIRRWAAVVGKPIALVAEHRQEREAGRRALEQRRDHVDEAFRPHPFDEEPRLGELVIAVERRDRHGVADAETEHGGNERRVQIDVLIEIGSQPLILVARAVVDVGLGRDAVLGDQQTEIAVDEAGNLLQHRPPPARIDGAVINLADKGGKLFRSHL